MFPFFPISISDTVDFILFHSVPPVSSWHHLIRLNVSPFAPLPLQEFPHYYELIRPSFCTSPIQPWVLALVLFEFTLQSWFPSSIEKPELSSRHLYTVCLADSKQVSSAIFPTALVCLWFWHSLSPFRYLISGLLAFVSLILIWHIWLCLFLIRSTPYPLG